MPGSRGSTSRRYWSGSRKSTREAEAHWGFNYDWRHEDLAYVLADVSIDLERTLADVGVTDFELVTLP